MRGESLGFNRDQVLLVGYKYKYGDLPLKSHSVFSHLWKSVVLQFLNFSTLLKIQFEIENPYRISSFIMSTTRSQKRKDNQQESTESVSEGLVSPIVVENPCFSEQDVSIAGPSRPKVPRIEIASLWVWGLLWKTK